MADGTNVSTAGGNVRVIAQNNGNIQLGLIDVGAGNVSLIASRSILDANGTSLNIAANNLRMEVLTGTIGTSINPIETQISVLAARSATGIFVFEGNGVRVDNTGTISVQQANFNSTRETVTDASFEDLQTTNGTIHLRSAIGNIVVNSGADAVLGVSAGGPGNDVILQVEAVAGLQSGNIVLNTLVRAADDVTLISNGGSIDQGSAIAMVQGDFLTIEAGQYAHLHNTQVNRLGASVGSNAILNAAVGQVVNDNASKRGDDFLDNLKNNVPGTPVGDAVKSEFQFANKYSNGYSLFIVNQTELVVSRATAGIVTPSDSPNIYIETRNASNLTIAGDVITRSSVASEGGIVLVAGKDFSLLAAGKLETQVVTGNAFRQTIENIGPGDQYLGAKFYDGGEGNDPNMRSTKTVIQESSRPAETSIRHVNQRVAVQFGFAGEQGFVAIIGYADGGVIGGSNPRAFDVSGEQGTFPGNPADQTAISSYPATTLPIA
ncbi:MAG TPA: hypothetical protein VM260_21645, partial [Pirellula sp.]|nr:hypothetical protein [Pirellula sp.]